VSAPRDCPGCALSVRLAPGEAERILAEYFGADAPAIASPSALEARLRACAACPDLRFGSTCRHCGCLVEVRARVAGKACPAPEPRWASEEGT
jgi:hypothetical protein